MTNYVSVNMPNVMKKGDVYTTTDYSLFMNFKCNRDINQERVKALAEQIKKYGLVYELLTFLSSDKKYFIILDGGHRFEGCKLAGYPVDFKVLDFGEGVDPFEVLMLINTTGATWTMDVGCECLAKKGLPGFVEVCKYAHEFGFEKPTTVLRFALQTATLGGYAFNRTNRTNKTKTPLQAARFKLLGEPLRELTKKLADARSFMKDRKVKNPMLIIEALNIVYANADYSKYFETLLKRLKTNYMQLSINGTSIQNGLERLNEIYNYGLKKNRVDFKQANTQSAIAKIANS